MGKELQLSPDLLGFVSATDAAQMGATPEDLADLDYLRMRGRVYYRRVDVESCANKMELKKWT